MSSCPFLKTSVKHFVLFEAMGQSPEVVHH
jgi:hypothetical protein